MSEEKHDEAVWHCHTEVKKFDSEGNLYDTVEVEGNLVMYGGVSNLWQCLIGNGGSSALAYFNNTNAAIGVGDSTTAAAATHTDLQASTNKLRKAQDATYPQATDGTGGAANAQIVFRSTFGSAEANFDWNEWGVFNSATAGAGRMLNRKQESLGTKVVNSTWQLTVTLSIA